jgi:hypothetical protein
MEEVSVILVEVHHDQVKNSTRPSNISNMMEFVDMYRDVASPWMHLMYGIHTCTLYLRFLFQTKICTLRFYGGLDPPSKRIQTFHSPPTNKHSTIVHAH